MALKNNRTPVRLTLGNDTSQIVVDVWQMQQKIEWDEFPEKPQEGEKGMKPFPAVTEYRLQGTTEDGGRVYATVEIKRDLPPFP